MSLGANINVWTLGNGANGQWKLHHTTDNLEDAADWFARLDGRGKRVALYELGVFLHDGKETAGQVAFWWNELFNEYMERAPEDRGVGWSDGFGAWVEYDYPEPATAHSPLPWAYQTSTVIDEPQERYVEAACQHCGVIRPMNQLQRLTHEVRAGRSSGASHSSGSTSRQSQAARFQTA